VSAGSYPITLGTLSDVTVDHYCVHVVTTLVCAFLLPNCLCI